MGVESTKFHSCQSLIYSNHRFQRNLASPDTSATAIRLLHNCFERISQNDAMSQPSFNILQSTITSLMNADRAKSLKTQLYIIKLCKEFIKSNQHMEDKIPKSFSSNSISNTLKFRKLNVDEYLVDQLRSMNIHGPLHREVVNRYITMSPLPPKSLFFELLKEQTDLDVIKTALRVLLYKYKDYNGAFQMLKYCDQTLRDASVAKLREDIVKIIMAFTAINYTMGLVGSISLSNTSLIELYFINAVVFKKLFFNPLLISTPNICWIPGVSHWQKLSQFYKLQMYSKVVGVMKECYYINVSNFDLQSTTLLKSFGFEEKETAKIEIQMNRVLREEGLILIADEKEQLFKDYWDAGGEGFEWIEPERDPVEFLNL